MSEMELNAMTGYSIAMMEHLIQATRTIAARVGRINGVPLEWDDGQSGGSVSPLLKLRPVGAQFKGEMFPVTRGPQEGHRVVFGWVNNPTEIRKKSPPDRVWNLTLSRSGDAFTWDVNRNEIVGASSVELAEKIVTQLVDFRDEYTNSAGYSP
jgi:hypothetical protein